MIHSKWLGYILILTVLIVGCQALPTVVSTPTSSPVSLEDIALLIIHEDGFVNTSRTPGSILASDKQAWRYQDGHLTEVSWSDYESALNSNDRNDWPPYTITFSVSPLSADQAIQADVTTVYDMGATGNSRGGNTSIWKLKYQGGGWQVLNIDYTLFSD